MKKTRIIFNICLIISLKEPEPEPPKGGIHLAVSEGQNGGACYGHFFSTDLRENFCDCSEICPIHANTIFSALSNVWRAHHTHKEHSARVTKIKGLKLISCIKKSFYH